MSNTARAVGTGLMVAVFCTLPLTQTQASTQPVPASLRPCLGPILSPPHSPDVMQGWIDGCRLAESGYIPAILRER